MMKIGLLVLGLWCAALAGCVNAYYR